MQINDLPRTPWATGYCRGPASRRTAKRRQSMKINKTSFAVLYWVTAIILVIVAANAREVEPLVAVLSLALFGWPVRRRISNDVIMPRFDSVIDFEVHSSGNRSGEIINFGASFTARFRV